MTGPHLQLDRMVRSDLIEREAVGQRIVADGGADEREEPCPRRVHLCGLGDEIQHLLQARPRPGNEIREIDRHTLRHQGMHVRVIQTGNHGVPREIDAPRRGPRQGEHLRIDPDSLDAGALDRHRLRPQVSGVRGEHFAVVQDHVRVRRRRHAGPAEAESRHQSGEQGTGPMPSVHIGLLDSLVSLPRNGNAEARQILSPVRQLPVSRFCRQLPRSGERIS